MDFHWAVVFFPYAEYYACEKDGTLNIVIQRSGNLNVSSYVTISGLEQTAKEGLDYISRRVSKLQFNPGQAAAVWKILLVKDDLEEAPIEQLQVILSDSENAILINYNRTLVSIYDYNTGSCEQVLKWGPQGQMVDANSFVHMKSDDSEEDGDSRNEVSLNLNFSMKCAANLYGLLHFEEGRFFQCDGENWIQWKEDSPLQDLEMTKETAPETTPQIPILEEGCLKGWQEFSGHCYKWHKPPATWEKAERTCTSYPDGHLVQVQSLRHNNWLLQMARNKPFWRGPLSATSPFVNWKKGFPRGDHRCVLVRGSGFWINKNCESHEHSYICSMPRGTTKQ